jgi:hypothetical protein
VIGRDPTTDPKDYKRWNEDAMICDIWTGCYYPASWLKQYLCSFVQNDFEQNRQITYVGRFDPSYQGLEFDPIMPITSVVDDFTDSSSEDDPEELFAGMMQ